MTKVPTTIEELKSQQEQKKRDKELQKRISLEYEKRMRYDLQHTKYTPPEDLKDHPLLQQDPKIYGGGKTEEPINPEENEEIVILKADSE